MDEQDWTVQSILRCYVDDPKHLAEWIVELQEQVNHLKKKLQKK